MDNEITCFASWGRNGVSLVKQAPYRNCPPGDTSDRGLPGKQLTVYRRQVQVTVPGTESRWVSLRTTN